MVGSCKNAAPLWRQFVWFELLVHDLISREIRALHCVGEHEFESLLRLPGRAPFNLLRRNYSSRLPWEWVSLDCLKIGHIARGTVRPGSRAHSKDAGIRTGNDVAVKWCQINTTGQSGVRSERKHVKGTNDAVEKRAEITDGGNAKWAGCWEKKGGGAA